VLIVLIQLIVFLCTIICLFWNTIFYIWSFLFN